MDNNGVVVKILAPFITISNDKCGELHKVLAISTRFPPNSNGDANSSVPLEGEATVARGTDGKVGSGIYSIDSVGESADLKVALLAKLRKDRMREAVGTYQSNLDAKINAQRRNILYFN